MPLCQSEDGVPVSASHSPTKEGAWQATPFAAQPLSTTLVSATWREITGMMARLYS